MPKDRSRTRKASRPAASSEGMVYVLQVRFDQEDYEILQELAREEKSEKAPLLRRLMREEYKRRHPN